MPYSINSNSYIKKATDPKVNCSNICFSERQTIRKADHRYFPQQASE